MAQLKSNVQLNDKLILPNILANLLGYRKIDELLDNLKNVEEGLDIENHSNFYNTIIQKFHQNYLNTSLNLTENDILTYDSHILSYFTKIKENRNEKMEMRYYQYIALLFTEIYLDKYFRDKAKFLESVNYVLVSTHQSSKTLSSNNKLAFWMATGSGKTIIMHINYLQFIYYYKKYNMRAPDNYILITPSEYMTRQHLQELDKSGINAMEFNGATIESYSGEMQIKVLDMNKLKGHEDKIGNGVTIDIDSFGNNNLLLVDEGHKGYKSEERKWASIRKDLAFKGFTFEYSATFGQALVNQPDLIDEYSKAIIFDYSYKFFYKDDFGKEFFILNVDPNKFDEEKKRNIILLGSAISFAEQLYCYNRSEHDAEYYGIEKPLWMFVGTKVNVSDKKTESDIYNVIKFLIWVINNKSDVLYEIDNIISGNTKIKDDKNNDVFGNIYDERLFPIFRDEKLNNKLNAEDIYYRILNIFGGTENEILNLSKIKGSDGEIGLKLGDNNKFFGLIDIGDRDNFLKNIDDAVQCKQYYKVSEENFIKPIFNRINTSKTINILIGAKKFIEGWDTYRVSNISLLHVGRSEGAQIIQLFGRGIRLKGINNSMKRNTYSGNKDIYLLQTLFVFGVNADYIATFRDIIMSETRYITIKLITTITGDKDKKLPVLGIKNEEEFYNSPIKYKHDISIVLKLTSRGIRFSSTDYALNATSSFKQFKIPVEFLSNYNWEKIYFRLMEFKNDNNYPNLTIDMERIKSYIMDKKSYEIYADIPNDNYFEYMDKLLFELAREYIVKNFNIEHSNFVNDHVSISQKPIDELSIKEYILYVDDKNSQLKDIAKITMEQLKEIPSIKINDINSRISIYEPLLIKCNSVPTVPVGLNEGEANLVNNIESYIKSNEKLKDYELYLLRNATKGKGMGYYSNSSWVYPDFILWIIKNSYSKIIFLEPHGLVHSDLESDSKVMLFDALKRAKNPNKNVTLDSFVISVTPYKDLQNNKVSLEDLAQTKHILFQNKVKNEENHEYVKQLFEMIGI